MIDLEKIHEMWDIDSQINENDLEKTTVESSRLHAKYLKLYNTSRVYLKKSELKLSELKQEKWRYFAGKMTKDEMDTNGWDYDPFKGATKPMKSELGHYIDSDKDIQTIQYRIECLKIATDALEEILNTLRWRHQTIRNILEWKKFTSGV